MVKIKSGMKMQSIYLLIYDHICCNQKKRKSVEKMGGWCCAAVVCVLEESPKIICFPRVEWLG
jgi:hypothetical protein